MVVGTVHHRDAHGRAVQRARGEQAAEAATQYHYVRWHGARIPNMRHFVIAFAVGVLFSAGALAQHEGRDRDRDRPIKHHKRHQHKDAPRIGAPDPYAPKVGAPDAYAPKVGAPNPYAPTVGAPNPYATQGGTPNPFHQRR